MVVDDLQMKSEGQGREGMEYEPEPNGEKLVCNKNPRITGVAESTRTRAKKKLREI